MLRTEVNVELHKQTKDDGLSEQRDVNIDASDDNDSTSSQQYQTMPTMSFDEIVVGLQNPDLGIKCAAAWNVGKFFSEDDSPPIASLITAGVIPNLVACLTCKDSVLLQLKACWALTNITAGTSDQSRAIVQAGAIPILISLLSSPDVNVAEEAVLALGNIAFDCAEFRDAVNDLEIISPLLSLLGPHISTDCRCNIVWILSVVCYNENHNTPYEVVKECAPAISVLLSHSDAETVRFACWAISDFADGPNENIQLVIDTGVIPRLVELLQKKEANYIYPAIRAVGNIVTGDNDQAKTVIDAGTLGPLKNLINYDSRCVVEEVFRTVSNITAGNLFQIQAVLDSGIMDDVIRFIPEGDYKCQKEAARAVTNVTVGGSWEQILYLVQAGAIAPMCNLLTVKNPEILTVLLDGINNILSAAAKIGAHEIVCCYIVQCSGLDKIEALQQHKNLDVCRSAIRIIDTYFSSKVEDEEITLC